MKRTLYTADHDPFRDAVRAFLQRSVQPHAERFIDQRLIDRDVWHEAGKQGFLGLGVPEEFGGSDDYFGRYP